MTTYNLFGTSTPGTVDSGDGSSYVLGLHFKSSSNGVIKGLRFYKASSNTGTHIGRLIKPNGETLGSVTFSGESASGWQEQLFSAPIAIAANTEYIASIFMPSGHYSLDSSYFLSAAFTNGPLTAYKSADVSPGNSSYRPTSSRNLHPTSNTFQQSNYWIDVIFDDGQTVSGTGNATRLWTNGEIPDTVDGGFVENDNLGMDFTSSIDGYITGVRFYKASTNTGTHIANLWRVSDGAKLAEKTFSGESASGWQEQLFDTPVAITAGTHYRVSYTCGGHFSYDSAFWTNNGNSITNSPLTATTSCFASGTATPTYPSATRGFNYWVDAVFSPPSSGPSIPVLMNAYRQRAN